MKRDTFERLKKMGINFDDDFENKLVKPLEKLREKLEEEKKLNVDTLVLNSIEDVDFINQTLFENKKNSANGFYYLYDGTFLGNYGISKEVVVCAKKSDREDKKSKKKWQEFLSPIRLIIENEEFLHFSASIFGESLMGYKVRIKEEVFAFATTIGNYITKMKEDKNKDLTYREAIEKNGVKAAGKENYKNFINEKDRNTNLNMKLAISGVINELIGGTDYSYGATLWDGIDIKKAKWKDGLKFAKNTHDVFGLEDNKNEGKELWETPGKDIWLRRKWEYKYITTIAYSGENKKKKNPYYPYYDDDKVNQNMFATTFIKVHPDFENIIPVKTKKDE